MGSDSHRGIGIFTCSGLQCIDDTHEIIGIIEETFLAGQRLRLVKTSVAIQYRQCGETKPNRSGRMHTLQAHFRTIGVRSAIDVVVQILKLTDAGVSRFQHLEVELRRNIE